MGMPTKIKPKTKLPSEIIVLGKLFKVIRCEMKEEEYGETDGHGGTIRIKSNLTQQEAEDTLVHEIIHAALHTSGLTAILERCGGENVDIEEAIVICLENALAFAVDINKFKADKI